VSIHPAVGRSTSKGSRPGHRRSFRDLASVTLPQLGELLPRKFLERGEPALN
jgi:hypothetical protein